MCDSPFRDSKKPEPRVEDSRRVFSAEMSSSRREVFCANMVWRVDDISGSTRKDSWVSEMSRYWRLVFTLMEFTNEENVSSSGNSAARRARDVGVMFAAIASVMGENERIQFSDMSRCMERLPEKLWFRAWRSWEIPVSLIWHWLRWSCFRGLEVWLSR